MIKPAQAYALFIVGLLIGFVLTGTVVLVTGFERHANATLCILAGIGACTNLAPMLHKAYVEGKFPASEGNLDYRTKPIRFFLLLLFGWFGVGMMICYAILAVLALIHVIPMDVVPLLDEDY